MLRISGMTLRLSDDGVTTWRRCDYLMMGRLFDDGATI